MTEGTLLGLKGRKGTKMGRLKVGVAGGVRRRWCNRLEREGGGWKAGGQDVGKIAAVKFKGEGGWF